MKRPAAALTFVVALSAAGQEGTAPTGQASAPGPAPTSAPEPPRRPPPLAPRPTATPHQTGGGSLADVVRRSQEGRTPAGGTRSLGVIDNQSLKGPGASPAKPTPPPSGRAGRAASGSGAAPLPPYVATDNSGKTEEMWRTRARDARSRLARAEDDVRRLEGDTKRLENDFYAWSDGNYRDRVIKPAWDKSREDLKKARTDLDSAAAAVAGLEEEARKAGAPPGWLR